MHWSVHIGKMVKLVRPYIRRRRQTGADVAARFVDRYKIKPSIRTDVHSVIGLIVQLERKRQWHECIAVINVVTGIGRPRHDRIRSLGEMYCWGGQPSTLYVPLKAALILHPSAVIAPAPMLAVTLPPKVKCTVNWAVLPLTVTAVTLPPRCRSRSDRLYRLTLDQWPG